MIAETLTESNGIAHYSYIFQLDFGVGVAFYLNDYPDAFDFGRTSCRILGWGFNIVEDFGQLENEEET